jgi:hypothetical protein
MTSRDTTVTTTKVGGGADNTSSTCRVFVETEQEDRDQRQIS